MATLTRLGLTGPLAALSDTPEPGPVTNYEIIRLTALRFGGPGASAVRSGASGAGAVRAGSSGVSAIRSAFDD